VGYVQFGISVIYVCLVSFGDLGKYENGVLYGIDVIYGIYDLLELDVVPALYDPRFRIDPIVLAVLGRSNLVSVWVLMTAYYVIYGDHT